MADNKVAEAYVEVGAKMDKLDKDLKRTEKKVEDGFKETGKKAANALESPIVAAALRATASFGALELGVGGVNVAVDALTGEIGDAAEAVKRLPAGIGPFATQLETLLGTVTGIRDEIEKIERTTAALQSANAIRLQAAESSFQTSEIIATNILDIQRQIAMIEAPPEEKPKIAIQQEEAKAIEAAEKKKEAIEKKARKRRQAFNQTEAEKERRARIQELNDQIKDIELANEQVEMMLINPQAKEAQIRINTEKADELRREKRQLDQPRIAAEKELAEALSLAAEGYKKVTEEINRRAEARRKDLDEQKNTIREEKAIAKDRELSELQRQAESVVESLTNEADLATTTDPFERERIAADQRMKVREAAALEIQTIDQALAEEARRQSEHIHEAELADIDRREKEKADQEMDALRKEQGRVRQERARELAEQFDEQAKAEEAFERERARMREEDMRMQLQIDGTEAITRQANQARMLRPGDRGFGSTAGTKEFDRPQKVESKTLDDIKALLERRLIAGDAFA